MVGLRDLLLPDVLLHNGVNHSVTKRDSSLHSQEVIISVTIAELDLELLPDVPEGLLVLTRVAELAQVGVDSACPLDLVQLALELGKADAELDKKLAW